MQEQPTDSWKRVMNVRKQKNWLVFSKTFNFWMSRKELAGLNALELVEQLMMDTFFVKVNSIWENWINTQNCYFAGKSDNNFHFRNQKSITFFVTFTLSLFDSGDCLPFNNGNEHEKPKMSINNFKEFYLKQKNRQKISKTYIRVLTTFITLLKQEKFSIIKLPKNLNYSLQTDRIHACEQHRENFNGSPKCKSKCLGNQADKTLANTRWAEGRSKLRKSAEKNLSNLS